MEIKLVDIDIDAKVNLRNFSCKVSSIDSYLKENAFFDTKFKLAITKLAILEGQVVGFYSLGVTEFYNEEDNVLYYGVNLDYLAIDYRYRNRGIGSKLLEIAVGKSMNFSNEIGCRYLVLDALENKVEWYEARGFERVGNQGNNKYTVRMVMDFANLEGIKKIFEI